jgi:hypothetical protein
MNDPTNTNTSSDVASQTTPEDDCRQNQQRIFPASRVMFCGRCGHATGGGYGHYSMWCRIERKLLDTHHFCCPASCERQAGAEVDPVVPCHPSPDEYVNWTVETDASRRWTR